MRVKRVRIIILLFQDKRIEFANPILYKELASGAWFLPFCLIPYPIRKYEFLCVYSAFVLKKLAFLYSIGIINNVMCSKKKKVRELTLIYPNNLRESAFIRGLLFHRTPVKKELRQVPVKRARRLQNTGVLKPRFGSPQKQRIP